MRLLYAVILIPFVHSYERIKPAKRNRTTELYRLSKVVNPADADIFFGVNFWSDVFRNNFSESAYANTCKDAYIAMKLTYWEISGFQRELPHLRDVMAEENNTARLLEKINSDFVSHMIIKTRIEAVDELSVNALPETRKFIQSIQAGFMKFLLQVLQTSDNNFEKSVNEFVTKLAHLYKEISAEIKKDIERSFCARNTLKWINAELNGTFEKYFLLFTEEIGLDIDQLMKNSEYLSTFTPEQVKEKFKRRADMCNMPAQEYVDTCSKIIQFINLDNVEKASLNDSISSFMGNVWGRTVFNKSDELLDTLHNESAPFINIVSRRWNFLKQLPGSLDLPNSMSTLEGILIGDLLDLNNEIARNSYPVEQIPPALNEITDIVRDGFLRELEPAICIQSVLEHILQIEIGDD